MPLVLVTPPAADAVDQAELLAHLRLTDGADVRLPGIVASATEVVENETRRQLVQATWDLILPGFPAAGEPLELRRPPLVSVASVTYLDVDGQQQTLVEGTDYRVNTVATPGSIYPVDGWPDTAENRHDAVTVRFVAGYGADADAVPRALRQALLILAADAYDLPGTLVVGTTVAMKHRDGLAALLGPYVVPEVF